MPFLRNILVAGTCFTLASSADTASTSLCLPNVNFRLEAQVVQKFLSPGFPCLQPGAGPCYTFFSVGSTDAFEYTIEPGTTNLMIAAAPQGNASHGQARVGDYIDLEDPRSGTMIVKSAVPAYLKCAVLPDLSDIGTCNLDCEGPEGSKEKPTSQLSIDPYNNNQWNLGADKSFGLVNTIVKAVY